jgi:hypothetical protein
MFNRAYKYQEKEEPICSTGIAMLVKASLANYAR